MNNLKYSALLHNIGFSHKNLHEIFSAQKDFKVEYEKIDRQYLESIGIKTNQIDSILIRQKKFSIKNLDELLIKHDAKIISFIDPGYPESLKNIHNPPFVLYVQGELNNNLKFSVVGSRKMTSYGQKCIDFIVPELGKYFEIISGGALGCDTAAHLASLDNNIKTIVVVGTGLDDCYPKSNKGMYEDVVRNGGAIVSIFPFLEPGSKHNFPVRNEIVAGLSVGTIVIEAQKKSGSLITANLCLDLGKDVFACPGDIFKSNSAGCNDLIVHGAAKMVRNTSDILSEYNISVNEAKKLNTTNVKFSSNDVLEKGIYDLLLGEPLSIDELLHKLDSDIQKVSLKISLLEIGGYIQKSSCGKYELK